jgi:hypothetical protein
MWQLGRIFFPKIFFVLSVALKFLREFGAMLFKEFLM